ncbi:LysR substrate-binding domain-containing protein [Falsiruegeria mediterranea]|jgi:flavin reductase (DIM6/NTAB) family NADH-FMN oxidoreductase RutF
MTAPDTTPIDPDLRNMFLGGMSQAACTVNIISTDGKSGRAGVTVSAMSSVSADTPRPTLLVCVHHMSPAAQVIIDNSCFVVNVLRDDQSYISDTFAGRFKDQINDKFDCTDWVETTTGALRVADPLVAFDCKVISSERVGTHHVFFGEVQEIYNSGRGSPLIYANRAYGAASRIEGATSIDTGKSQANHSLSVGCFHSFGPYLVPEMMRLLSEGEDPIQIKPVEGDQRRIQGSLLSGECEVALLYDHDLPDGISVDVLATLELYVLLPENDPLATLAKVGPKDLADRPMIHLEGPPTDSFLTDFQAVMGHEPNIAFRPGSLEMVRSMVGHGLGYTVLATKPASSMTYDGKALITRPYDSGQGPIRIVVGVRKGVPLTPAAERFLLFCRDFFGLDQDY